MTTLFVQRIAEPGFRDQAINQVIRDSTLADAAKRQILMELLQPTTSDKEAYHLAQILPYVLGPGDANLLQDAAYSSPEVLKRLIWAFGEMHCRQLAPALDRFISSNDDEVLGIALTALAKCDPALAAKYGSFRCDGRRLIRKRYIEGFEQPENSLASPATVVFVRVQDSGLVGFESTDHSAEVLHESGLELKVTEEEVPSVSDMWGIWVTWGYPVLTGLITSVVYDLIRLGMERMGLLRRRGEHPRISFSYAKLAVEAQLTEQGLTPFELVKAVMRHEAKMPENPHDVTNQYVLQYRTPAGLITYAVSYSGELEMIDLVSSLVSGVRVPVSSASTDKGPNGATSSRG